MEKKSVFPNIGNDFEIIGKIKEGGFGEVFLARDTTNNTEFAIKLEKNVIQACLPHEIVIYQYLSKDPSFIEHMPSMHFYGEAHFAEYMAMDYMGLNLNELLKLCGGKFSLKTVLMIADQMLQHIEFIHSKGLLHRDIKPNNFVLGRGEKSKKIYLIDFGSSDFYIDSKGEHINWCETTSMIASVVFGSINNHLRNLPFRKDDLESIGFCLCYFIKGKLPWQEGLDEKDLEYQTRLMKIHDLEKVYQDLPEEFETYVRYCRRLKWFQDPDYQFLRNLFKNLFEKNGFEFDYIYDWDLKKGEEHKSN